MGRAVRLAGTLLIILALLTTLPLHGLVLGASLPASVFSGYAIIAGPVSLELSVSPAVTTPGSDVLLTVKLANNQSNAAAPEVFLAFPTAFSTATTQLPAGATVNYQANSISWAPILQPEARLEMTVPLKASVADNTRPEQEITARLVFGTQEQTARIPVWIGLAPEAAIELQPKRVAVGQPVKLSAISGGTGPFSQLWSLGDGRQVSARDPEVIYGTPGNYTVGLQLANPLAVATAEAVVEVVPEPTAGFMVSDDKLVPMEPVQFQNQAGGEPPLTFLWDFGDGSSSSEREPVHFFPAPGYYQVRLLVTSPYGQAETSQTLVVGSSPTADFMLPAGGVTGTPVTFEAFHDGTVNQLHWQLSDGAEYYGDRIQHTFRAPGTFDVVLRASNDFGEVSVTKQIVVEGGIFTHYLPALYRAPVLVAQPAQVTALDLALMQTPPSVTGTVIAGPADAGGAGPSQAELPPAVMPQVDAGSTITVAPPTPASDFAPITLPPQAPLPAEASRAEALLWYINEARRLHSLPPLQYSYELSIAAQTHTEDVAYYPDLMHQGPDGSTPADRQARAGFSGYYAGETVAWGWQSAAPAVEFWVNSAPHRVILLNPNATHVGVGYYADATAANIWYWTAEFGLKIEEYDPFLPPAPN